MCQDSPRRPPAVSDAGSAPPEDASVVDGRSPVAFSAVDVSSIVLTGGASESVGSSRLGPDTDVFVHGVPVSLRAPILEVWAAMRHPDQFLYLCLMKSK
jgi:hypothetical protein